MLAGDRDHKTVKSSVKPFVHRNVLEEGVLELSLVSAVISSVQEDVPDQLRKIALPVRTSTMMEFVKKNALQCKDTIL